MDEAMTEHDAKAEAYRLLSRPEPFKCTLYGFMLAARVVLYALFFLLGTFAYHAYDSLTTMYALVSLGVMGELCGNTLHRAIEVERKNKKIMAELEAMRHDGVGYIDLMNRIVDDLERHHRR